MPLHRRNDRGELVDPSGAGPRPKVKFARAADGSLEIVPPDQESSTPEVRPDERPAQPEDPRWGTHNPHTDGW